MHPQVVSGKFREIFARGNTLENPGNTHVIIGGTNSGHVMYLRPAWPCFPAHSKQISKCFDFEVFLIQSVFDFESVFD
jgi:hypothetical protein